VNRDHLVVIADLHERFEPAEIEYWLFGGWAVDFHAGRVTRDHSDIDVAVWQADAARVHSILEADGWRQVLETDADGYTAYERRGVRVEVAFLARDEDGVVYTPLVDGRGDWPEGSFGDDVGTVDGVRARVMAREALIADKSVVHGGDDAMTKDRIDLAVLRGRAQQ
jgi:hypothetical protein